MIKLFDIGTKIQIGEGTDVINAVIIGICIRANRNVTYQCSWVKDDNYHSRWVEAFEVEPCEEKPKILMCDSVKKVKGKS